MKHIKKLSTTFTPTGTNLHLDELKVGMCVEMKRGFNSTGKYVVLCRPNMFDYFGDCLTLAPVVSDRCEGKMIHLPKTIALKFKYDSYKASSFEFMGQYVDSVGNRAEVTSTYLQDILSESEGIHPSDSRDAMSENKDILRMQNELNELKIVDEFCFQVFPSLLFSEGEYSLKIQSWSRLYSRLNVGDVISLNSDESVHYAVLEVPGEQGRSVYSPWVLAPYNKETESATVSDAFEYYFHVTDTVLHTK